MIAGTAVRRRLCLSNISLYSIAKINGLDEDASSLQVEVVEHDEVHRPTLVSLL